MENETQHETQRETQHGTQQETQRERVNEQTPEPAPDVGLSAITCLPNSIAWDAYVRAIGGKSFAGQTLPPYDAMYPSLQNAWYQFAREVHDETIKQILARYDLVERMSKRTDDRTDEPTNITRYIGVLIQAEGAIERAINNIFTVEITVPCGYHARYTFSEFPRFTTPCPCGDPAHTLVEIQI